MRTPSLPTAPSVSGAGWKSVARGSSMAASSGRRRRAVFSSGPIEVQVPEGGVGCVSALKMCFAAYSKGSIALACTVLGAAARLDVFDDLKRRWARSGPSLPKPEREISRVA